MAKPKRHERCFGCCRYSVGRFLRPRQHSADHSACIVSPGIRCWSRWVLSGGHSNAMHTGAAKQLLSLMHARLDIYRKVKNMMT